MKKASSRQDDDLRPEYDFSSLRGGVRGKYYRRFQAGTNIVRLEPDLANNFGASQPIPGVGPTRGGARTRGGPVRLRRAILLLGVAVLGAVQLSAEDGADIQGARVRVKTTGAGRLVGVVADADADSLMIQTSPRGGVTRVPRDDVLGLEVSRGFRRHTVRGLVGGAVAWVVVVGLYAAFDTLDESGVSEPLFIGGMVAAGGLVGTLIKTERWEPVSASGVSLRMSPRRRGVQAEVVLTF